MHGQNHFKELIWFIQKKKRIMSRTTVTVWATYAVYFLRTLNERTQFHGNRSACQAIRNIYSIYAQIPYYSERVMKSLN